MWPVVNLKAGGVGGDWGRWIVAFKMGRFGGTERFSNLNSRGNSKPRHLAECWTGQGNVVSFIYRFCNVPGRKLIFLFYVETVSEIIIRMTSSNTLLVHGSFDIYMYSLT